MSKKAFVVILILSVVVWYISRYIVPLYEIFIQRQFKINIFGDSCLSTGYPLSYCADNNFSLVLVGSLNIAIWFVIIWLIWKIISYFSGRVKQ